MDRDSIKILKRGKNLLAFSAGVDSSALFFMLLQEKISFDIALINYGLRKESIDEEMYAISLAKKYNKRVYISKAPKFNSNFEKNAREYRYDFFSKIIKEHNYSNLITAHQLNDQLEWFLMRLTKGAGVLELLGLNPITKRDNYMLIRPILDYSKDELLNYLKVNNHKYFVDSSNIDQKYERNYFRKNFSNRLIDEYKSGIKRTFNYLREDSKLLLGSYRELFHYKELYIIRVENSKSIPRVVDIYLKRLGYLLSSAQRDEVKRSKSLVIGGVWAIEIVDNIIYIAPYINIVMPKSYKERCRVAKIPPKIRGYYFNLNIDIL